MGFHMLRKLKCETQLLLLFSLLTSYFPFTKFPSQQLPPEHLISSSSKCDESKTKAQVEFPFSKHLPHPTHWCSGYACHIRSEQLSGTTQPIDNSTIWQQFQQWVDATFSGALLQPFALCLQLDYYYYYCLECDSSGRTFFLETNHGNNEQGQVKCRNLQRKGA